MKQGKTLQELAAELTRQRETRRDFVAPTSKLAVSTDKESTMQIATHDGVIPYRVNDYAHGQLASFLKVPKQFYDRLRHDETPVVKELFDHTVNTLLERENKPRLVCTLDNTVRGFLSNRFQPYDNYELAESILPIFSSVQAEVSSCEVTATRFYLKVVSPKVTYEVAKGDIVQAGLVISNSEVGAGRLKVEPLIHRLVCLNGMIAADSSFRKNHAGKALGDAGDSAFEFFSDETRRQTDKPVFMQIRDIVQATLTDEGFRKIVQKFKHSKEEKLNGDAFETMDVVQEVFRFNEEEKKGVLHHLIAGQDMSKFGLVNALTRYSQDVQDYDRATDFERFGGQVIELAPSQWRRISEGASA